MKLILQILLILVIASTIGVCVKKPDMHKTLFVYDSAYIPVETKADEGNKQIETVKKEEVVVYEQPAQKPVQKTTTVTKPTQQTFVKKQTTKTSAPQTKTTTKTTQPQQTKQVQKTETKPVQTETKVTPPKPKPVEVVKTEPITKPVTVQTTTQTTPPVKVLTQQEEEIAWNAWRSTLQNKIMRDVKLPTIPNGVVFKFSFTVDKFGKISNLQTWAEPSTYTPHAIQYIAPVIRSYQGRSILKFPEGSTRTVTTVKGGWKISSVERYSTPKDYNDIERVQK